MSYTEDQLTPWFDGSVKPMLPGVYWVDVKDNTYPEWKWSYFDGKRWGGVASNRDEAETEEIREYTWLNQNGELARWRGLNFNPTKRKGVK